ncbi:MAG TPA: response regulator [Blastocatellia bacterium]|nr:response regulator [Blastocatellia bacterium]
MSVMTQPGDKVIAVVDDMFFAAKINSAASAAGRQVERVKSREQLEQVISTHHPSLVLVDLNSERLDPLAVIEFFKSRPETGAVPIVGFVSHVQTELIRRAQEAGCDYVLPRSAFSQLLPEIVAGNLTQLRARQSSK